jgi:hypothetical protein
MTRSCSIEAFLLFAATLYPSPAFVLLHDALRLRKLDAYTGHSVCGKSDVPHTILRHKCVSLSII